MSSQMAEAIRQLIQEKGLPEKAVLTMIEDTLKAAYKREFGTNENAVVEFAEDLSEVYLYSKKIVVDGVYDPAIEIELEDALKLNADAEIGDEIVLPVDPKSFGRSIVQTGKQTAHQSLSEIQKDRLYAEFKDKVGEVMVGYFQREDMREGKNKGTIYVDLGKVEGILPKRNQSPRERFEKNDRIRAIVTEVKKTNSKGGPGLQLVLSRTDPDFVRRIMEQEIPETYDKTVEIYKIVREPGYRTKVAVYSHREDIDPVGACVGQKGVRIQSVIRELDGEKIDILKYDPDPAEFIKNALSPAEVTSVMILDADKRQALACVPDSQFSLAIGKQGLNVRLANRLVDWNIDVKTDEEYEECSQLIADSRKAAESLFIQEEDTISTLEELPGVDQAVVALLKENGIVDIGQFLDALDKGTLSGIEGLSAESIATLENLINAEVELVEEEVASTDEFVAEEEILAEDDSEEEYRCPECNAKITIDMTACPNCGIGLSFEVVDEE